MAPNAGIVATDIMDINRSDDIIEGMKLMCEYAEEKHKPIAINMSLGNTDGWGDGCAPISAAMIELTDNGKKPGGDLLDIFRQRRRQKQLGEPYVYF